MPADVEPSFALLFADLAKQAGIPADMIESWIADKGGKVDTDKLVRLPLLVPL
jgi:hypothetical protein